MILPPLNDETCLAAVTQRARDAVQSPEAKALAERVGSVPALRRYLQTLPQRDDAGDPADGPRIDCGDTSQRVRLGAENPNCCERGLWFLAVAERIDPRPIRQLATIDTPRGRHTFPVEDGDPVRLDPVIPRNALAAGLYHIRNAQGVAGGALLAGPAAVTWIAHLAAENHQHVRRHRRRRRRLEISACFEDCPCRDRHQETGHSYPRPAAPRLARHVRPTSQAPHAASS